MKALVADDDPISRLTFRSALVRLGVEVVEASDGSAAWDVLAGRDAPRLALLDWHMPGLDGLDLCRRLRARSTQPYVYAALVTARNGLGDVVAGFEAGADDFITKPVELAALAARVQAARRLVELHSHLEQSRSYLSAVIEHLDHGAMLADAEGRIVCANPALTRVFGTGLDETIGRRRADFLRDQAHRLVETDLFLVALHDAETGMPRKVDFEVAQPERRVYRWECLPVSLPEGTGVMDLYQDVTVEVDQARAQEHLARTDPLTGLVNRRGLAEAAEREVSRASRTGSPLTAVVFDIDHFKRINDQHGHPTGDRVLRHVARCLVENARCTDVVARWGGEELLVLLPDTDVRGGHRFAERVRTAVAAGPIDLPFVTVSAGVHQRGGSETIEDAIAQADARLYEAKASGRDAVR
ncbi:MAG TPA: diguanylate cyclase [Kofleriaceae bacterium]|nr:diguanylate cyclase [Kofleriaceae bacterium]